MKVTGTVAGAGLSEGPFRVARGTAISCKGGSRKRRARKTRHNCYNQICIGIRIEHSRLCRVRKIWGRL